MNARRITVIMRILVMNATVMGFCSLVWIYRSFLSDADAWTYVNSVLYPIATVSSVYMYFMYRNM